MILIHSCNSRLWYVNNFLIPSLHEQGITDIDVFNDNKGLGNLKAWCSSCLYTFDIYNQLKGVWHIQDDVLLCSDFAQRLSLYPSNIICNGFCSKVCSRGEIDFTGYQNVKKYWMSFPCIYIPNRHMSGFLNWFYGKCIVDGAWQKAVSENRYDDFFFWTYMKECCPDEPIYNIKPSLVQHVDYLINGSVVNKHRHGKAPAYYWNESDRELDLERRIKEWQDQELK